MRFGTWFDRFGLLRGTSWVCEILAEILLSKCAYHNESFNFNCKPRTSGHGGTSLSKHCSLALMRRKAENGATKSAELVRHDQNFINCYA